MGNIKHFLILSEENDHLLSIVQTEQIIHHEVKLSRVANLW